MRELQLLLELIDRIESGNNHNLYTNRYDNFYKGFNKFKYIKNFDNVIEEEQEEKSEKANKENVIKSFVVLEDENIKKGIINAIKEYGIETVDCIIPCVYGIDEEGITFSASPSIKETLLRNGYKEIAIR